MSALIFICILIPRSLAENKRPARKPEKLAHFLDNFLYIALLFAENDRRTDLNFLVFRYGLYSRTSS